MPDPGTLVRHAVAALVVSALSGCAAYLPMEFGGLLYREQTLPLAATPQAHGPGLKVGRATVTSYLGLVNIGDAGIEHARRDAGISRIAHVDVQTKNILGVVATYTVIVYGD